MKTYHSRLKVLNPRSKLPLLIAIPGGSGLSGKTLKGIEVFTSKFRVAVLNPAGTGGTKELSKKKTREVFFDTYISDIEYCISDYIRQSRSTQVTFLGHSYGGIVALEVALRLGGHINAVFCLSSPLRQKTLDQDVTNAYLRNITPSLEAASSLYEKNPSNVNFRKWLSEYGGLFFSDKSALIGRKLMLSDKSSVKTFQNMGGLLHSNPKFYQSVRKAKFKKAMIAAGRDLLVPHKSAESDAKACRMNFYAVPMSGHFSLLDRPEAILKIVAGNSGAKSKSTNKKGSKP